MATSPPRERISGSRLMGPPPPRPKTLRSAESLDNVQLIAEADTRNGGEFEPSSSQKDRLPEDSVSGIIPAGDSTALDTAEKTNADGSEGDSDDGQVASLEKRPEKERQVTSDVTPTQPYTVPPWGAPPGQPYSFEILKDGCIIANLDLSQKGAYMFGRSDRCDLMLEHPSISRYHAVLQFKRNGNAFVYDLGSTHGTFVNKLQIQAREYVQVYVGDILKLGLSTRLYVLQGPMELMPKEGPTKADRQLLRHLQAASEQDDLEASLLRARREAVASEGATWGMMEDAIEEDTEMNEEEVTWQNYKGVLTEKQQKTLEKIQKRNEKLMSLRREIDAIQAKEIPQGGLTQGQQTQVARNEQRIEQLMEELENLEETLNQSIQESIGARAKKGRGKHDDDDGDDDLSDDDDFYDRTKQGNGKNRKIATTQVVETAESLLEKREKLTTEMENVSKLLEAEEKNQVTNNETVPEHLQVDCQDPLDAFMTDVSSKIVKDRAAQLRKQLEKQQTEFDRIVRLLKIADPTGEASTRWQLETKMRTQSDKPVSTSAAPHTITLKHGKIKESNIQSKTEECHEAPNKMVLEQESMQELPLGECDVTEKDRKTEDGIILNGPVWLGAGRNQKEVMETTVTALPQEDLGSKDFIDYRERRKAKEKVFGKDSLEEISNDAAGLILRKPITSTDKPEHYLEHENEDKLWAGAAESAAESVAQLLRHERGLGAAVDNMDESIDSKTSVQAREKQVQTVHKKRRLGPEKPAFLVTGKDSDYESWLPPEGQTGDGRTALNAKFGY